MEPTNGGRNRPQPQPAQQQQQTPSAGNLSRLRESESNAPTRAPATSSVSMVTATPDSTNPAARPSENSDKMKTDPPKKKKKKHRHRHRRNRRPSFLAPEEVHHSGTSNDNGLDTVRPAQDEPLPSGPTPYFHKRNLSNTSLESDALLDHRHQPLMRPRRDSRPTQPYWTESYSRQQHTSYFSPVPESQSRRRRSIPRTEEHDRYQGNDDDTHDVDDRTPLIRRESANNAGTPTSRGGFGTGLMPASRTSLHRQLSDETGSSHRGLSFKHSPMAAVSQDRDYDVNNPPSVPASPELGLIEMGYDDAVVTGADFALPPAVSPELRGTSQSRLRDAIINMDGPSVRRSPPAIESSPTSPRMLPNEGLQRRRTVALPVEEDVCFPTELAEVDFSARTSRDEVLGEKRRRHRRREWPDLSVLEEWSREEKEERSGEFRVKKISEPVLIGGRLRPQYAGWRREEEDAPYRFTYFNEDFQSTIHAQSVSELVQPGGGFRELFIPDPPELEDSSDDEEEDLISLNEPLGPHGGNTDNPPNNGPIQGNPSLPFNLNMPGHKDSRSHLPGQFDVRSDTDLSVPPSAREPKQKRYGPRPTWWLDVLCPTDPEMRVIAKAFGIHALTAEDIMMQEAREKVELFRNYYFLNYRTFEQDSNSENYLDPVNMYVVVFREGVLSFHFSQTPHPANVRRRIRQLRDYLILSSDWISYALIDDITDVFGPLIQGIENEVDEIDDTIMEMQSGELNIGNNANNLENDGKSEKEDATPYRSGNMLRRVGICRKKVMGMYRLLNTKADVIKGFAKRCNEQWEVAPKSEIGLYLGDIQDHIMTMTSNLTHYETLLSRAHSNYLAQINIDMNERSERTADVLGKLTVLGTIVLPMNIICGMWGMNVKVPGQEVDNLWWFWSITAGLFVFAFVCFYVAKRVYRIV